MVDRPSEAPLEVARICGNRGLVIPLALNWRIASLPAVVGGMAPLKKYWSGSDSVPCWRGNGGIGRVPPPGWGASGNPSSYQRTSAFPPGVEATVCWVQIPVAAMLGSAPPTALESRVTPVLIGGPLGWGAGPGMAHPATDGP